MERIITILILTSLCRLSNAAACSTNQIGNITCSDSLCSNCNNGTCTQCCTNYYVENNACIQCADINCLSCSATSCSTCISGYATLVSNISLCHPCMASTDANCLPVNNCDVTSTCANCNLFCLNDAKECLSCNLVYRRCSKCNNIRCMSCQSNYVLNSTANYKQCGVCRIPNCQSCGTTTTCNSCKSGYYKSNSTCAPCKLPCLTCNSLITCSSCDTSLQLIVLVSSRCVTCSSVNPGCQKCSFSSGFVCHACFRGFYLFNSSCNNCTPPCLKCANQTKCLSCVNESYLYNSNNFTCVLCQDYDLNCITCTASICVSCTTGYFTNGSSCFLCNSTYFGCETCSNVRCRTCQPGLLLLSNDSCIFPNCSPPCAFCGLSSTHCIACIEQHYLSGTSCLPCVYPCRTCSSSTYCISCFQQMEYSSGVCTPCSLGQQFNPFTLRCEDCPQHCLSCSWWDGCHNCTSPLFALASKQCVDICGDTFATDLQCDTVLGVPNDGCTDSCTVEPNYNCTKVLNTTLINNVSATVNVSQCSYVGSVSVAIVSAAQSIFANTLKLGFSVRPFLSGMPSNSDPQTYLRSVFVLSPFDALASYSITVDAHLGVVFFTIDHDADISSVSPTLTINYEHLASVSPMFQYMANLTYSSAPLSQMVAKGRVGEAESEESLQMSRAVYGWSCFLAVGSVLVMGLGVFGKELAGLDQALLCQQLFLQILFSRQRLSFPLLSLSGLKFSTGLHFEGSLIALSNTQSYVLGLDASSFLYHFGANLVFYSIPLVISFILLVYKLWNKHSQIQRDIAQQRYEVILGECILYLVMFNLTGFISYTYLFYQYSSKNIEYYESVAITITVLINIFAFYNFLFQTQIVGIFRSSFKIVQSDSPNHQQQHQPTRVQKFYKCISKRFLQDKLSNFYVKSSSNFYSIFLIYLIVFLFITIFLKFQSQFLVLILQILMLIFVILVRPHFNPFQKLRSLLTWFITILGTITVMVKPKNFILPFLLTILLTLHLLFSVFIITHSIWSEFKRKNNKRTVVVKDLWKEAQIDGQKRALNQLIQRYEQLERKKDQSIDQEIEKIRLNFSSSFNSNIKKNIEFTKQQFDSQRVRFEEQIILEQHSHIRYQKGLQFFNKYQNKINEQLIKEYQDIESYQ